METRLYAGKRVARKPSFLLGVGLFEILAIYWLHYRLENCLSASYRVIRKSGSVLAMGFRKNPAIHQPLGHVETQLSIGHLLWHVKTQLSASY